jgi:hypothetical protein
VSKREEKIAGAAERQGPDDREFTCSGCGGPAFISEQGCQFMRTQGIGGNAVVCSWCALAHVAGGGSCQLVPGVLEELREQAMRMRRN